MKSLHKVLDIIEILAEKGVAGIHTLSQQTGFPPSTVHRIVNTLKTRGYLKVDEVTKAYRLSARFLRMGSQVQQTFDLVSVAKPYLQKLVAQTSENANLAVEEGDEAIYIDHIRGTQALQLFTQLGAQVPLYCTGVGKLMLCERSDQDIIQYLVRTPCTAHTPHTLTAQDDVLGEINRIREQGYAIDNQELSLGVRCLAASIRDYSGRMLGAVSVSGASQRFDEQRVQDLSQIVTHVALDISNELGFSQ